MTQQDYNNHESLRRPEISVVSIEGIKRRKIVTTSPEAAKNALIIMKSANTGGIYETASKWAERSNQWGVKSDFLSAIAAPDYTPADPDEVYHQAQMEREIELSKRPPNTAELGLYLDGLNTPEPDDQGVQGTAETNVYDNVRQISDARARLNEIRNREAA